MHHQSCVAAGARTPHLTLITGFILNPESQLTNQAAGRIMPRDHEAPHAAVEEPSNSINNKTADRYVRSARVRLYIGPSKLRHGV
jgi:hypothetical protein